MKKLAIIFPGIGYTTDKPLLYYALDIAYESGYQEYRKIRYETANKEDIRCNEKAMEAVFYELYAQAEKQMADIDWSLYEDVLFISKSIGTMVATAYARNNKLTRVKHVLYTPLKNTYSFEVKNAIAFIGTSDGWSDYKEIERLSFVAGIELEIYEGCNHSLETEDTIGNIERLHEIMKKTKDFLVPAERVVNCKKEGNE